jgi:hypothetical protein
MKNTRRVARMAALAFFFVFGAFLGAIGLDHGRGIDLRFLAAGGMFLFAGMLGTCGVNVWRGGPLDPRNDPTPDGPDHVSPP